MKACPAGFQSLPTELQSKILGLAAAADGATAQLRRVCKSWQARAWTDAHTRTSLQLAYHCGRNNALTLLPYLPRLTTLECCARVDLPRSRFLDAVLTAQLRTWPNLVSLELRLISDALYLPRYTGLLRAATRLTQLTVDRRFVDEDSLHAFARALPQLAALQTLALRCEFDSRWPQSHLEQQLSALTRLTDLCYMVPGNHSSIATLTCSLACLTALKTLQLDNWPSSASAYDRSAWHVLMGTLRRLPHLNRLHIDSWQLDHSSSKGYFAELRSLLAALPALNELSHNAVPQPTALALPVAGKYDPVNALAGSALVQVIA